MTGVDGGVSDMRFSSEEEIVEWTVETAMVAADSEIGGVNLSAIVVVSIG